MFGPERVAEHVDRKIAERITEGDVADWKFIEGLTPSSTVDLEGDTYRLFARLQNYRPELESILRDARTKPEFAAIDLDNYFGSKSRSVSRG